LRMQARILLVPVLVLLLAGCDRSDSPYAGYDKNTAVPEGDPPFTALTTSWVIDNAQVLARATVAECDAICQRLKDDGIAEVVVLVQNGVRHPEDYATHYGRWLKLGKAAAATEGGQNGVVWLVRPDAELRMTVSVGRGLPRFTSADSGAVMDGAADFINFNNFDAGVLALVKGTDKRLRELYPGQKGAGK